MKLTVSSVAAACFMLQCAFAAQVVELELHEQGSCNNQVELSQPFAMSNQCIADSLSSRRFNCDNHQMEVFPSNNDCLGDSNDSDMRLCSGGASYKCVEYPDNVLVDVQVGSSCVNGKIQGVSQTGLYVLDKCVVTLSAYETTSTKVTLSGKSLKVRVYEGHTCSGDELGNQNVPLSQCSEQNGKAFYFSPAIPGTILADGSAMTIKASFMAALLALVAVLATVA